MSDKATKEDALFIAEILYPRFLALGYSLTVEEIADNLLKSEGID